MKKYLFIALLIQCSISVAQNNLEKVSLQFEWIYQFEYAGFIAAKEKGFYKEAGLEVDLMEYSPGIDIIKSVLSRKANFGIHNSSLIIHEGQVAPMVLLATYLQQSPLVFIAREDITRPSHLIGKRVMGTTDEFKYSSLALMLDHFFISEQNSKFVEHTFHIDDFINGNVDVMSAFRSNQLYELDNKGIKYNILDPIDYGFYMSAVNLYSSREEALEYPTRTQNFIKASNKGWKYALENTDEIIDIIYNKYSKRKSKAALKYEAEITKKMMLLDFFPIGRVSEELSQRTFSQLKQSKLIRVEETYKQTSLQELVLQTGKNIIWSAKQQKYFNTKEVLKLCVDPEWMPFESLNNENYIGIAADIFSELIKPHIPISIEVVITNTWNDSIKAAKARECDLFSLAASTPERLKYMDFTEPYINLPIAMVTTTDKYFIENIAQVRDRPIGIVKGYAIAEILRTQYDDINIIEVDSISNGLKMVESGELFGYIDNLMVIAENIQKKFTGQLKVSARLDERVELAIGTRNDEPQLNDIFSTVVEYINQNEKAKQKIYNNWVSIKYEMGFDYRYLWIIFSVIAVILIIFFVRFYELRKYNQQLRKLSITDPLTQAYNRLRADELLEEHYDLFKRYNESCGLIMLDIDFFKLINDEFGHQMGDKVLVQFTEVIQKNIRVTDKVCRWGGEEFMIICPHLDLEKTHGVAEKLLNEIKAYQFAHNKPLTASLGVGVFTGNLGLHEIITKVDNALYRAKDNGRAKVEEFSI